MPNPLEIDVRLDDSYNLLDAQELLLDRHFAFARMLGGCCRAVQVGICTQTGKRGSKIPSEGIQLCATKDVRAHLISKHLLEAFEREFVSRVAELPIIGQNVPGEAQTIL